jgi:hypothetical protein
LYFQGKAEGLTPCTRRLFPLESGEKPLIERFSLADKKI